MKDSGSHVQTPGVGTRMKYMQLFHHIKSYTYVHLYAYTLHASLKFCMGDAFAPQVVWCLHQLQYQHEYDILCVHHKCDHMHKFNKHALDSVVCILYCNSFHNNLEIPKVSNAPLRLVEIHRCPHHCSRHGSSRPSPCQFGFPMRTHWIPETPLGYICINLEAWKLSSWVNVTQNWFEWALRD